MAKRKITGYAKNTGKYVLKGAAKTLGLGLAGSGIVVNALSKSHIVRGIGTMAATVMCPAVAVCAAEAMVAKNLIAGIVTDYSPMDGIAKDLQKSNEISGRLIHEIGKGMQEVGNTLSKEADKIKMDR